MHTDHRPDLPDPPLRHVVFFDKPADCTSHDAVQMVKKICNVKRAGHGGTLDPAVTGLLVVALSEARKAMPILIGLDKEYEGTMRLHGPCSEADLRAVFAEFLGTITQLPPVRSRVKREERQRTIHELEVLALDGQDVRFRARTQAGTYIRKLVHDMGERLGIGAHMSALRRTSVGPWRRMVTREDLAANPAAHLIPMESVLEDVGLKQAWIGADVCRLARNGQMVEDNECERLDPADVGETLGLYHAGHIHALTERIPGGLKPVRVFLGYEPEEA